MINENEPHLACRDVGFWQGKWSDEKSKREKAEADLIALSPPIPGCSCVCHSYPEHGKLQDALEALRWYQDQMIKLKKELMGV